MTLLKQWSVRQEHTFHMQDKVQLCGEHRLQWPSGGDEEQAKVKTTHPEGGSPRDFPSGASSSVGSGVTRVDSAAAMSCSAGMELLTTDGGARLQSDTMTNRYTRDTGRRTKHVRGTTYRGGGNRNRLSRYINVCEDQKPTTVSSSIHPLLIRAMKCFVIVVLCVILSAAPALAQGSETDVVSRAVLNSAEKT